MEISTKITGGTLDATEFNQIPDELENLISSTSQTPSDGDLFQVSKSVADYSAHGDFFTDSGAADAYVLSALASKQSPTSYADGMRIRFVVGNSNTGASTINVATLGAKSIVNSQGNPLVGGELLVGASVILGYRSGAGNFIIVDSNFHSGRQIQDVGNIDGAVATGTTVMVLDDSIPQNTEGDEYLTQAITPRDTGNILEIEIHAILENSNTTIDQMIGALFQDSVADALAATAIVTDATGEVETLAFKHRMVAGTLSPITFKFRAGAVLAGTTTFNGAGGSRLFGGVAASSITVCEILP